MHRYKHREAQHSELVGELHEHCGPLLGMAHAFEEELARV